MPARKTQNQIAAELAELESDAAPEAATEPTTYERRTAWVASLKPEGHGPQGQ